MVDESSHNRIHGNDHYTLCNSEGEVHDHEVSVRGFAWELIASSITLFIGLVLKFIYNLAVYSIPFFLLTMIISGRRIFIEGLHGILNEKKFYVEFLVMLAAIGAFIIGEYEEGSAVIYLFNIASFLEGYASERAKKSIELLLKEKPQRARVIRNGVEVEVEVEDVSIGEVVAVRPGEKIPLDGIVIEGSSNVNEAPLTGESIPVSKSIGDKVFAGTINVDGFLKIKVEKEAHETVFSRVMELVMKARREKAEIEQFIRKFSQYYTPIIILTSLIIGFIPPVLFNQPWYEWAYRSLTLLVISCPCALAISTPVAMVSGLTSAARNGVLIKGGRHLEHMTKISVIAFDKTGTLTKGELKVSKIIPANNYSEDDVIQIAYSINMYSEHPIARAVVDEAIRRGIKPLQVREFKTIPGEGVVARINGTLYVVGNERIFERFKLKYPENITEALRLEGKTAFAVASEYELIGVIGVEDEVRDESRDIIYKLRKRGLKVVMLTGDNEQVARIIAEKLGIDEFKANLTPEDKIRVIREMMYEYNEHVAMVGDGINDAPALANACIGIAIGTGTEIAIESGDIVLMKPDLRKIPYIVELSHKAMDIIKQNIAVSIGIKGLLAALALIGLVSLWMAVGIGDMGLSFIVILNAMRLANVKSS